MPIYIRGLSCLSPQATHLPGLFLEQPIEYGGNNLQVVDPGYRNYLDPKLSRRMSKVIKMGVSAARICLDDSGVEMPGAIITGTGLGCIEDTENFLREIVGNKELLLTPTPFIQSTHNTVAAQVALMLKCHSPNFTFVHRGFSLELALQDAMLHLTEGQCETVLAGAVDELTLNTVRILERFGLAGTTGGSNLSLYENGKRGTIFGEGSAFFLLHRAVHEKNYAELRHIGMLFSPGNQQEVERFIHQAVQQAGLELKDLDLVIGGMNGSHRGDTIYPGLQEGMLGDVPWAGFKHLCGEFHTASGFALWAAARILKEQRLPECMVFKGKPDRRLKNILIYNQFLHSNHIVLILQGC